MTYSAAGALRELLLELELKLMDPTFRQDRHEVAALLADEFLEFGSSGKVWTREEILVPPDATGTAIRMEDFAVRMIHARVAQATYRTVRTAPGAESLIALRSSLWSYEDGRWQMVFHQGTRIP